MTAQADTVTTTITVGPGPVHVAIDPAGTFAYVTNGSSNSVSKIALASNTVVGTITVGTFPRFIAIDHAGTFAYVASSGSGNISKINLATDTVDATFSTFGGNPYDVAVDPAGIFVYATNATNFLKINLATNATSPITGSNPRGLAINPAGTFAYVANYLSNTVSKISTFSDESTSMRVVATITVGSGPKHVAINPAGTFAYVTNAEDNTVSKINLATDTVIATVKVGLNPFHVAINPAGTFAYVTNASANTVSKINLATDTVIATVKVGLGPNGLAIDPAGTFAYVTNSGPGSVSKIALTATEPQLVTFTAVSTQLLGAKTVALSASASSTLAVAFTSATPTVCTVSGSTVTMVTLGDCTINANQAGETVWDVAPQVSRTFTILPSPPAGEAGVSIKNGASYTNSKQVTLNLIWPEYATGARLSNDGGFTTSKTQTKDLAASIDWELDDSVKGIYTKVVYVRFNGVADTTKTYTDDIILDTTAPTIETSSAAVVSSSVDLSLKATDDITGVNKVEIRNDAKTVTKDYATKVSVPMADLSLSVSTSGVQKSATTAVDIRVSDNAGNWTGWQTVTVIGLSTTPTVTTPTVTTPTVTTPTVTTPTVTTPTVTTPTVTISKSATAKSIAIFAKIPVLSTSKVSLKVVSSYAKYCKVSGTTLRGVKNGTCKVTVTVTPKKSKAISKTVTLKVSK